MNDIIEQLSRQAVLPLFFHPDKQVCEGIMRAMYEAGIRIIEFTNRGEQALENFAHMKAVRDKEYPDLLIAAGTIKSNRHATDYIQAGVDFLISPGLNKEVGEIASRHHLLWVPGCMTPSEIMLAEQLGARLVKLFPGSLLGPSFVDAIKELFPALKFIPTGGVKMEKENLAAWFRSGVIAVGAGSTLIDKKAVQEKNYDKIRQDISEARTLVKETKKFFHNP